MTLPILADRWSASGTLSLRRQTSPTPQRREAADRTARRKRAGPVVLYTGAVEACAMPPFRICSPRPPNFDDMPVRPTKTGSNKSRELLRRSFACTAAARSGFQSTLQHSGEPTSEPRRGLCDQLHCFRACMHPHSQDRCSSPASAWAVSWFCQCGSMGGGTTISVHADGTKARNRSASASSRSCSNNATESKHPQKENQRGSTTPPSAYSTVGHARGLRTCQAEA